MQWHYSITSNRSLKRNRITNIHIIVTNICDFSSAGFSCKILNLTLLSYYYWFNLILNIEKINSCCILNINFKFQENNNRNIPNVTAEWLALFHIWEVPVHVSARRRSVVTEIFVISSVPPGKCRCSTLNYNTAASFHVLSNSLFINHLITRRLKSEIQHR
jgi:hypothetical protein